MRGHVRDVNHCCSLNTTCFFFLRMDMVQTLWTHSLVASSAYFGAFWNTRMGDIFAQGICLRPSYQALSLDTYFTFSTLIHLRDSASHLQGRLGQSGVADGPAQVPIDLPLSRGVSGAPHRVTSGEGAPTDSSADLAGFGVRPVHTQTRSSRVSPCWTSDRRLNIRARSSA